MYDSLEGLDYKSGECGFLVRFVLKNMQLSLNQGYIIKTDLNTVKMGDVIVFDYNSVLVTNDDPEYIPRYYSGTIDYHNVKVIPNIILQYIRKYKKLPTKYSPKKF